MPQLRPSTLNKFYKYFLQKNFTKIYKYYKTNKQKTWAYSLVRVGADESKQLPQQDTVGGLVPAVLYGQWLQECEGAAAVAGHVTPPMAKQETRSGSVDRKSVV